MELVPKSYWKDTNFELILISYRWSHRWPIVYLSISTGDHRWNYRWTTGGQCKRCGCHLSGPLLGLRWIIVDHRWTAIGFQPGILENIWSGSTTKENLEHSEFNSVNVLLYFDVESHQKVFVNNRFRSVSFYGLSVLRQHYASFKRFKLYNTNCLLNLKLIIRFFLNFVSCIDLFFTCSEMLSGFSKLQFNFARFFHSLNF